MVFQINSVDLTPSIAFSGIKWSRSEGDGPNAGRMQNAEMVRDRIATKYRWDITCRPLTATEQATILQLIQPEFVYLTYTDPLDGVVKTGQYYSNNFPSTYSMQRPNGEEIWTGLAFPLVER